MRLSILVAALALGCAAPAAAQTPPPPVPVSTAVPADVATPEAIVAALYDVISGDAGVARDWPRFRSLFHPTARLMPSGVNREGQGVVRSVTPDEYITRSEPLLVGKVFTSARSPAARSGSARSFMSGPATKACTVCRTRDRSPAASTAFSCSTTAPAGGSSASTGRPKPRPHPSRRSICRRRRDARIEGGAGGRGRTGTPFGTGF